MQAVFGNKNKTFRPKKNFQKGTKLYQLHKYAKVEHTHTLSAITKPEREPMHLELNSKTAMIKMIK